MTKQDCEITLGLIAAIARDTSKDATRRCQVMAELAGNAEECLGAERRQAERRREAQKA